MSDLIPGEAEEMAGGCGCLILIIVVAFLAFTLAGCAQRQPRHQVWLLGFIPTKVILYDSDLPLRRIHVGEEQDDE